MSSYLKTQGITPLFSNFLGDTETILVEKTIRVELILLSPNGTAFVITVDDDGNLSAKPQVRN